jgi:hypothetical protein
MNAKTALRASAGVWNRQRARSSHSSVAKKLSHMALSYASPTEPIDGRTPASRQRRPNSIEVYWVDSIDRRNTRSLLVYQRHRKPTARCLTVTDTSYGRVRAELLEANQGKISRCGAFG